MPGFKGHLSAALGAWVVIFFTGYYASYFSLSSLPLSLCATLAGAIFPDIDTKSRSQRIYAPWLIALFLYGVLARNFMVAGLSLAILLLPLLVAHRSLFHRLTFISLLAFMATGIAASCHLCSLSTLCITSSFFITGAWSHLMLDFKKWRKIKKFLR